MLGLRTLLALQRDRLAFLQETAARGDVVRQRVAGRTIVLLARPDAARSVLTTHQRAFAKSPMLRQARLVLGQGLLTAEGATHRRHRRLVQPAFSRHRLDAYVRAMTGAAAAEVDTWAEARPLDADAALHRVALEVAGRTLFGAGTAGFAARLRAALDGLVGAYPTVLVPGGPLLRRLPVPPVRRLHRVVADVDEVVRQLVAARRRDPGDRDDLLSLLLAARDDEGGGLTDVEVRDEVVTLLLAGHETTAALLVWAVHLLAAHEDVRAGALEEVDRLDGDPTLAELEQLVRLRAVVAEALRLHPPSYAIVREAIADVDLGATRVAPGDLVVVSPWVLHRDPRWWVQSQRFAPERWDGVDPRRPQRAFLPFGAGSRMCVGEGFAWTEAVAVLAAVLRRVEPIATGPMPRPVAALTLRSGPAAPLRVRRRR